MKKKNLLLVFFLKKVVWKSTEKVGVGIATIERDFSTKTYIVARYTPPGNVEGRFAIEVGNSVLARKLNGE